ncbi:non-ribosomal peptide synthetase [Streptomyces sp. NPDC002659]|uniref:non-ribosomal peptide synthetase n=1 Tax=Streptomyces sp. NPDC002659 TaxID=3364656 RepID=UPI00368A34CE
MNAPTTPLPAAAPESVHAARVRQWNATARPYPRETGLAELFAHWARETPDACAVIDGDLRLSYRELDRRANALAHALVGRGVRPGQRVGLLGQRCADAAVAIVGIVKAGAVYVPLDEAHPLPRLEAMAEDAGIGALIALPGADRSLGAGGVPVLQVDGRVMEHPPALARPVGGEDLAYVMFTSGSTGRPKVVGVPQRGITRLVVNTDYITFHPDDRVLQITALTFDLSTFEIWGALLNGAALVVTPWQVEFSPGDLHGLLERHRVTVALISTAVFHQLVGQQPSLFARIRDVLVAGDALNLHLARQVLAHHPPKHLINAYGPTENTTFTTAYLVNDLPPDATAMPIGTPIANTTCYVLRDDGTLADIGEEGELVTGGDGVAAGYLNDPELTAERFVPDPFSDDMQARLYRTGDIASWHADGTIAFHGRRDGQFKIRGMRIEAAEIENALAGHNAVAGAVVTRHKTPVDGEGEVVAYLVRSAGRGPVTEAELHDHLGSSLPCQMIPAVFIWLDRLPLNPHGKIDRGALPDPIDLQIASPPPVADPTADLLTQVHAVWQEILRERGVEPDIAPDDTLFDVGGTSFDVPRIHARITELLEPSDLTPLDLFTYPTLRGYTDHLASLLAPAARPRP